MNRLIVPPFPAASRRSDRMTIRVPVSSSSSVSSTERRAGVGQQRGKVHPPTVHVDRVRQENGR